MAQSCPVNEQGNYGELADGLGIEEIDEDLHALGQGIAERVGGHPGEELASLLQ